METKPAKGNGVLNIHEELEELTNCRRLNKLNSSQADWLLDSSTRCRSENSNLAVSTGALEAQAASPLITEAATAAAAEGGEEEDVSEGLSRVDSTSTPHCTHQHLNNNNDNNAAANNTTTTHNKDNKTNGYGGNVGKVTVTKHNNSNTNAASPVVNATAACAPHECEDGMADTLITLEVSSSSESPLDVLSPPSPADVDSVDPSPGVRCRAFVGQRATVSGSRRSVTARRGRSAGSKSASPRPSFSILVGAPTECKTYGKKRLENKNNCTLRMSRTPPTMSPRPASKQENRSDTNDNSNNNNNDSVGNGSFLLVSPSFAKESCETSVATIPTVQNKVEKRKKSPSPRVASKAYMNSPDIVVSSDTDTNAAMSPPLQMYKAKPEPPILVLDEEKALVKSVASASASTSAVAVVGVYEVTGARTEEPLKKNANNPRVTLCHRLRGADYSERDVGAKSHLKGKRTASGQKSEEWERSLPMEELKLVAMEEDKRRCEEEEELGVAPHEQDVVEPPLNKAKNAESEQESAAANTSLPTVDSRPKELVEVEMDTHTPESQGDARTPPPMRLPGIIGIKSKSKTKCCSAM